MSFASPRPDTTYDYFRLEMPPDTFRAARAYATANSPSFASYGQKALSIGICLEDMGVAMGEKFKVNDEEYTPPDLWTPVPGQYVERRDLRISRTLSGEVVERSQALNLTPKVYATRRLDLLNDLVEFGVNPAQAITLTTIDGLNQISVLY